MRSYQLQQYEAPLACQDGATPTPQGDEVLVRIKACGVCHSDVHIWQGYFDFGEGKRIEAANLHSLPHTLGHEIVGTVESCGTPNSGVEPGDSVVVYPWIGCGDCDECKFGEEHHCTSPRHLGVHVDGGFADHVVVPHARYLFSPGNLPVERAATYACSGLTAYSALQKVKSICAGRQLLIIGAGGVGLTALSIAKSITDCELIVADIDGAKLAVAEEMGADRVVDTTSKDERKQLLAATSGGVIAVADFVGSEASAKFGVSVMRRSAKMVIVGMYGGMFKVPLPLFPHKLLTVTGSYVGSPRELGELLELANREPLSPVPISTRPLAEASESLTDLHSGRVIGRTVLLP